MIDNPVGHLWITDPTTNQLIRSVFSEAIFYNEIVLLVFPCYLEQVLTALFTQLEVDHVRVEPQLDNLLLLLIVDVAREDGAKKRRLTLGSLHVEDLELVRMIIQKLNDVLKDFIVTVVGGIVDHCPIVPSLAYLLSDGQGLLSIGAL